MSRLSIVLIHKAVSEDLQVYVQVGTIVLGVGYRGIVQGSFDLDYR